MALLQGQQAMQPPSSEAIETFSSSLDGVRNTPLKGVRRNSVTLKTFFGWVG